MSNGWIGVDLDGTLAHYDKWRGAEVIGDPITAMVERVKNWLVAGIEVRIFTARVDGGIAADKQMHPDAHKFRDVEAVRAAIQDWCEQHIGVRLAVTNVKDFAMIELWDDRCVRVVPNTGEMCCLMPSRV